MPEKYDEDLAQLRREVADLAKQVKYRTKKGLKKTVDQVGEGWETVKEKAETAGEEADRRLRRYARERPWQMAGMAVAAGFLVGLLADRRRD